MAQELRPRVLLADDNVEILRVFRILLEPFCKIIGSVNDGRVLLEAVTNLKPDVVIVDVSMPAVTGIDACRQIKQAAPNTRVVVVTAGNEETIRQKAFSVGASAFVIKHLAAEELLNAVRGVLPDDM